MDEPVVDGRSKRHVVPERPSSAIRNVSLVACSAWKVGVSNLQGKP